MVPSGWIVSTFEKHVDLLNGFAFKSVNYSSDECDIRLLRGDNIEPGSLRWRGVKRWPANELEKLNKFQLAEHDFVIAMDRTWITSGLKVAEVKQSDLPCLLVQRVSRIRALPTLNQSLLRQYFSGHRFEQYVKSVQTETAVPHISPSQIKEFSFLLPPLPEQQKIAKILSTWDKAISTTEALIDNSKQQKKALMQQLLTGKKRLLDGAGKRFEGVWEESSLQDLVSITYGKSPKGIFCDKGKYEVIGTGGVTGRTNETLCREVAVIIGRKGTIDNPRLLTSPFWAIDTTFYCCPVSQYVDINWFYYFVKSLNLRRYNESSGVPSLSRDNLYGIKVQKPKHKEQQKIASVLTNADKETELLQKQLSDLKQEKKALMQQLLTGKRRVKVDEGEAALA
jgi:type I restriction enzyme S subunit